ncbi:DUF2235 domain-containing protein [Vibrio sp. Y2-5]|uniref:phospholipase effector Tle1 domain-containing protein n=1 Tax=Vibrio sp. Y2-5 TaxID=2743977 RepID=UPI0016604B74|nr:DUF2235 domain-containing protein [Vibrio sp. Y2-5]MBD0787137.1 DUF2235 domain-containing protein [Vibrio sp. Y2-5]
MIIGPIGVSAHCVPCEKYTHWIEILIRDEHNQPFPNVKGILIDSTDAQFPITVGEAPILLTKLAPGHVTLHLETEHWRSETEKRMPNDERLPQVDAWLNELALGYQDAPRHYHHYTMGDFLSSRDNRKLPKRHQAGKLGEVKLETDKSHVVTVQGCRYITLRLGMFFDGTANNTYSARWGKERLNTYYNDWLGLYLGSEGQAPGYDEVPATRLHEKCFEYPKKPEKVEGSASNELTNIQKLFDLYQSNEFDQTQRVFSHAQYITGIGTGNSTDIAKADESDLGQGLGQGDYGVIDKVATGIEQVCGAFESIVTFIKRDSGIDLDGFSKLEFDVFGFSRGAAAARHFINTTLDGQRSLFAKKFEKACQQFEVQLTSDFKWHSNDHCEVMFAGLFDTVAAVVGLDLSAHDNKNGDVRLWLDPKRVRKAVHLVAHNQTEYRKNFSLNKLNPAPQFDELVLPGAHSDIGGGYHSRVAFSQDKYLLPLLENKLIKTVEDANLPLLGVAKRLQALTKQLEEALDFEVSQGWSRNDFIIIEPKVVDVRRESSVAQGHLIYRKCTEGDLSRLYLRVMYGLAEFAGVPISDREYDNEVWSCTKSNFDAHLHYPVQHVFNNDISKYCFPFKLLCEQALDTAKQGDAEKIQQMLGSDAQRRNFMELGLIHHSSDESKSMGILKPFSPHTINGNYQREEYECEQNAHINDYGAY